MALALLDEQGPQVAIDHLAQWDYGAETVDAAVANGHVYDQPPAGAGEQMVTGGDYALTYSHALGHIGLVRRIVPGPPSAPTAPGGGAGGRSGGLVSPEQLLVVEAVRATLREAEADRALDGASLEVLGIVVARADREVTVPHPDEPFDPPIFEGPASQAHTLLIPGAYRAQTFDSEQDVTVIVGASPLAPTGRASAVVDHDGVDAGVLERISGVLGTGPDRLTRIVQAIGHVTESGRPGTRPQLAPGAQRSAPDRRLGRASPYRRSGPDGLSSPGLER